MAVNPIRVVSEQSLAEAINTSSKIELACDIELTAPLPSIASEITVEGNGFAINGNERNRIFEIERGTLRLNNVSLSNGHESTGGAIFNNRGTLDLADCEFVKNTAESGGAVYNLEGMLNILNCTFRDNIASVGGGALYTGNGTVTLMNVSVRNNAAKEGGGIISGGEESLTITDCTFSGNRAENGGAIASVAGQSAKELSEKMKRPLKRQQNQTDVGALNISKSIFSNNRATNSGGAILVGTGTINVSCCEFFNNSVSNGQGGAIGIATHGTVLIKDSKLSGNSASDIGGAFGGNGKAAISHCTMEKNVAKHGGAVGCYNSTLISDSWILSNLAEYGGGVVCTGLELKVRRSAFIGNKAKNNGGAIYNYGKLDMERSSFSDNVARVDGGGIEHAENNDFAVVNCTFSANKAGKRGGGLLISKGKATLTHVTVAFNEAECGGGICGERGTTNLINCIVSSNQGGDCEGNLSQNVKNLIQDGSGNPWLSGDPMLGPLTGDPAFHPLLLGSPAIDAAHPDYHEPVDQRGMPRPQGEGIDIGAYEFAPDV